MLTVRPYRDADRDDVRRVCYETGFMGESVDWYWRDYESFVDRTSYYTDVEPESAFVVDDDGAVVGFLFGCVDSSRAPSPRVSVTRQLVRRQLLLRPGTAGFFWRAIADTLRHPTVPSGELEDARWPAHLHIDLLPAARGAGMGRALMHAWLDRLRALRVPGCHLTTLAENTRAIAFFGRMGFEPHGPPTLLPGMRTRAGERMHQQIMVRAV